MAKSGKNLILYQALELRTMWDTQIHVLKRILSKGNNRTSSRLEGIGRGSTEMQDFDDAFDSREQQKLLQKLETKRVKLNQAIQGCNFTHTLHWQGEEICLAEALEHRKSLLSRTDELSAICVSAAYKKIVHKEERDIEYRPLHVFPDCWQELVQNQQLLRELNDRLHQVNHEAQVVFADEK
ncbi:hypothetical protein [Spirochaeta dissipatitropha]